MKLLNKKKGALLATMLFCLCTAMMSSGAVFADEEKVPLFSSPRQQGPDTNAGNALYKMVLAVSIVAALGVAAIYTSKKVLPKFATTQGKRIKVLETVHLGPRKMVHLLDIGGQQILIGSTHDRITKLADIIDVVFENDAPLKQTPAVKDVK